MKKFIPILAYHSLDPARFPGNKLAISPDLFRKQMLFLKRKNFRAMDLGSCAKDGWKQGIFDRKVALTFDDGYLDNYKHAFPILKEFGLKATALEP